MRSLARKSKQAQKMLAASYFARLIPFAPFLLMGCAGILLIISSIKPYFLSEPKNIVINYTAPILSALGEPFRYIGDSVQSMSGINQLKADNEQLLSENKRLREWYQTAQLLQAENKSLRDLLNVIPEPQQRYISTRVISDSASSFSKTVLIKAGKADGIVNGQAVMAERGMIGRIIEISDKASRVLLLNDINSRVPVMIEGINRKAILAGTNDELLELNHMPKDILIQVGAKIITSGHGGLFPQGLPVGQVIKVDTGKILVRAYSDPQNVSMVQVIDKPDDARVRRSIDILTKTNDETISPKLDDNKIESKP